MNNNCMINSWDIMNILQQYIDWREKGILVLIFSNIYCIYKFNKDMFEGSGKNVGGNRIWCGCIEST